ncbi:LacI family DNA-binding transcriptional regulator [Clostridium botulinum]|nr:LacI family DNA-binding transcriptional regulator [Clostridium botulinum]
MAVTIGDIAKKAQVSLSTVSRVLNNSGYVKLETKEKILKVIKELNYTPSAIARSLSKNETNTIGVVVPDINNPYFGELIKGISSVADKNDLNIILFDTDESIDKELKALSVLKEQRIKGVIITPTSAENDFNSEYLKTLENLGIPIVLVVGEIKYSNLSGVFVDNIKGAFEGVEALIKEGHKKIGIITGRLTSKPASDRILGYKKALTLNNIPINEDYIFNGEYKKDNAYKIMKKILNIEKQNRPTALFISNNMMTLGCIKAILEESKRIPEDMAIVSFDKVEILNMLGMNISYIDDSTKDLGKTAMNMLLENIKKNKKEEIRRIILSPKLYLKGSEKYLNK